MMGYWLRDVYSCLRRSEHFYVAECRAAALGLYKSCPSGPPLRNKSLRKAAVNLYNSGALMFQSSFIPREAGFSAAGQAVRVVMVTCVPAGSASRGHHVYRHPKNH